MTITARAGFVLSTVAVMTTVGMGGVRADPSSAPASGAPVLRPVVLAEIPHDTAAYTEGLELAGDVLYEGTGLVGKSQLRELNPATGAVRQAVPLPDAYFGEGITVINGRIWQLTYKNGVAIEWDRATLSPLRELPMAGEGWGLCWDGNRLVRSDGTDRLHFHDPVDFTETHSITITLDGAPMAGLNELECLDGQVWAVAWPTDRVVRIDPDGALVTAVLDASGLLGQRRANAQVLSGIAHVGGDEFLLTGKYWPSAFRVRIDAPASG